MRLETLAIHGGGLVDPATGAVAPPIHTATTFERDADGGTSRGYSYIREANPTRNALEQLLANLESGAECAAFGSGLGAGAAVLQTLSPGDHVVAPDDVYYGMRMLLDQVYTAWGLMITYADLYEPGVLESALRPETRLVWIETPSNPMLRVTDIRRAVDAAHSAGAVCVCDNTFATPALQRPLDLGADAVMHSTTKWIGGHSDVQGGAVITRTSGDFSERLRTVQHLSGAVPSPFDCWLVMRGARTLPCRAQWSCSSSAKIAAFLKDHPRVEAVHYPGLAEHPGHNLAAEQMSDFGGVVSFQVTGGEDAAAAATANARLFTRATSLGGVESLIEHRAAVEGPDSRAPRDLIRLSIGLEHPDDLIADLAQALDRATR